MIKLVDSYHWLHDDFDTILPFSLDILLIGESLNQDPRNMKQKIYEAKRSDETKVATLELLSFVLGFCQD